MFKLAEYITAVVWQKLPKYLSKRSIIIKLFSEPLINLKQKSNSMWELKYAF